MASGYYDTQGTPGTGLVGDVFNTQTALYGGSPATAEAARQSTYDTAGKQIVQQGEGRQAVKSTLAGAQSSAEQLASQSGMSLRDAYNALYQQQNQARNSLASEASAIRGSGQVDTSGLAQQRASVAGLNRFAAAGPGPSGVSAAASQTRQQTLAQALASIGAGRGAAAAGANQGAAMGQAAMTGAQTAATSGAASAAENQAYRARQLQAIQAAGGVGASMQQGQQQIAGQALAREQAAAGVLNASDALALQYQQQMAGAQAARASAQAQLAQFESANAARDINSATTYAQQQGADLMAALGYRQNQLSTEAQLRNQGISSANSAMAGLRANNEEIAAKQRQADKASRDAMIGTGLAVGAAML